MNNIERCEFNDFNQLRELVTGFIPKSKKELKRELLLRFSSIEEKYLSSFSLYSDLMKELIVDQVIFDILFDTNVIKSPRISLRAYSNKLSNMQVMLDRNIDFNCLEKTVKRGMEAFYKKTSAEKIKEQFLQAGFQPESFREYYNPKLTQNPLKEKPEFIWHWNFYNYCHIGKYRDKDSDDTSKRFTMITQKQFERKLKIDSNYSYGDFVQELNNYNDYAESIFNRCMCECDKCNSSLHCDKKSKSHRAETTEAEIYFNNVMLYYYMETDKRVDYIIKLISFMNKNKFRTIGKKDYLVRRFHPIVSFERTLDNGLIVRDKAYRYYRPMLMLDNRVIELLSESFLNVVSEDSVANADEYINIFRKYDLILTGNYYIRAMIYEEFCKSYSYVITDYEAVKEFLETHYNLIAYHNSNSETWDMIKNNAGKSFRPVNGKIKQSENPEKMSEPDKIKEFADLFISINNEAYFPPSEKYN